MGHDVCLIKGWGNFADTIILDFSSMLLVFVFLWNSYKNIDDKYN